jgi:hypothetical protein
LSIFSAAMAGQLGPDVFQQSKIDLFASHLTATDC